MMKPYPVHFQKRTVPILILVSIMLGIAVYVLSTRSLLRVTVDPSKHEVFQSELPYIELPGTDTVVSITIKPESYLGARGFSSVNTKDLRKKLYINIHPAILKWILFYSVVLSLASVGTILMALFIIRFIRLNAESFKSPRAWIFLLFSFIILVIVSGFILYMHRHTQNIMSGAELMKYFQIIFDQPDRVTKWLLGPLTIFALFPCVGMLIVNLVADDLFHKDTLALKPAEDIEEYKTMKYKQLKDHLNTFALYAGLLVSTTIIGLGLQKGMLVQQITNIERIYPDEFIFAYGSSFTLILALFFLPSLFYLKYTRDREQITIEGKTASGGWMAIGKEVKDDVKIVFSIILPLLSSIIQSLIHYS